jgi:MFS family permease
MITPPGEPGGSTASEASVARTPGSARAAVRRLALGRLISRTGTFAGGIALAFTIYEETGSAAWIAATMVLTWGIAGLLGPLAGAIGDRFDRRRVMIASDVASGSCWAVMALFDQPAALLGIGFLASVSEAPFFPASAAAIPNVAGRDNLSWANSLVAVGSNIGLTIGPLLGGVLVATLDPALAFVVNAASFAVSALLVVSVRGNFADPERNADDEEVHRGFVAGVRFIGRDRVLRTMTASWFAFILGMAMTIVADPVLADEFGTGSFGYGVLTATWGCGTIVGSFLGRRVTEKSEGWVMFVFSGLVSLTAFGVAVSPWFWLVLVWLALFGILDGPTLVAEQNLTQRRSPDVVRSRVFGASEAIQHVAMLIALVLAGFVVPAVGPRGAYLIGGITGAVGTAILLPLVRWLPDRTRDEVTTGAADESVSDEVTPLVIEPGIRPAVASAETAALPVDPA